MIEEKEQKDRNKESPETEVKMRGDEKPVENEGRTDEIPLEKMTKSELIEKAQQLREESIKNYDLYLRSQAEMENIKKRNRKEKEDWVKYANETLIKEILPVVDNLETAISHSNNENSLHALQEGVALTLKGLKDSLKKAGVDDVSAQGEPFDPCFHQAVSEVEDHDAKPGTVIHELQKGYVLNQRLIRPAMVVVSKGRQDNNTPDSHDSAGGACEE
jgi:molecular chaperone GrpE